jgi:hypothetical protein
MSPMCPNPPIPTMATFFPGPTLNRFMDGDGKVTHLPGVVGVTYDEGENRQNVILSPEVGGELTSLCELAVVHALVGTLHSLVTELLLLGQAVLALQATSSLCSDL